MKFLIADTFTGSLAKLTAQEQKAVKTTAFDLQVNPAHPSMHFHRIDKTKDPNFWSIRVGGDIRIIVHKTESSFLICYVDHHDKAYQWAERRRLEAHPKTGAAQIVEVRETVVEYTTPRYIDEETPPDIKPFLFENISEEELLSYGVPSEWIEDALNADEDSILKIADHLPTEAAEALLDLATGTKPRVFEFVNNISDPFDHPDAKRRFRLMDTPEELETALEYPWEKWMIFLHPEQRQLVEREYNGPARVSGSAGTGKTIVALHRAVFLAKSNSNTRILLTTFSEILANSLMTKLRLLIHHEPKLGERLEVHSMNSLGKRLYALNYGSPQIVSNETLKEIIKFNAEKSENHKFSKHFLTIEWHEVIDAWQLKTWEEYRDVLRLGRKTRLPEKQRAVLWSIYEKVRSELKKRKLITYAEMFSHLAKHLKGKKHSPFDHVIIDESQDVNIPQLRFLAALGGTRPNNLFFAGDLGQRIFQQPFSWKSLGVDIRGRSQTLKINYRTSHQIRKQADKLLAPELSDVDGNIEKRFGTISVFNGPTPIIKEFSSEEDEINMIGAWIADSVENGVLPHEIGVFVRSTKEIERAVKATERAKIQYKILDENVQTVHGHISVSTMHLAKGLEFRAVIVMACDDEILPSQKRIETVADDTDLEEVYNTERHLLYVACTRARDHLLVTSVDPASEFLDDLRM